MGKRKLMRSKVAPRKKVAKLETAFCCPFCNYSGSVKCSIDLKLMMSEASCCVCKETYSTMPHVLTDQPFDVYSEWIDECEHVNDGVVRESYAGDDDDYA